MNILKISAGVLNPYHINQSLSDEVNQTLDVQVISSLELTQRTEGQWKIPISQMQQGIERKKKKILVRLKISYSFEINFALKDLPESTKHIPRTQEINFIQRLLLQRVIN